MPYNTNVNADTYFSERYGFSLWEALAEPEKTKALNSASQVLDLLCVWDGYKTDENQAGEFPRDGETEVPDAVKYAECEIAYLIVEQGAVNTQGDDALTELKAGPVDFKFKGSKPNGNPLVNPVVRSLLRPLGRCDFNMGGGSTTSIPMYRG